MRQRLLVVGAIAALCACQERPAPPEASVRERFPGLADQVLGGRGFTPFGTGYLPAPAPARECGKLGARFDGPGLFTLMQEGWSAQVTELGAGGSLRGAENALAYNAEHGRAYWSAGCAAFEEWLHVTVPVDGVVARWRVTRATLVPLHGRVRVVGDDGAEHLQISAPAGWTLSGSPVRTHLRVSGDELSLLADGPVGGEVLIDPVWTVVGAMSNPRSGFGMVLLQDGRVVAMNGWSDPNTSDVFDPDAGTWTPTGTLSTARGLTPPGVRLLDGRVLYAGGQDPSYTVDGTVDLFDPDAGTWSVAAAMNQGRRDFSMNLLADGRVIAIGGGSTWSSPGTNTAEIYDPATNSWTPTAPMNEIRRYHASALLPDGRVLVVGGVGVTNCNKTAEIFDPDAGTWTYTAPMHFGHSYGGASLVPLPDGTVLVVGGTANANCYTDAGHWGDTELFSLADGGTWTVVGSDPHPRNYQSAVRLAGGKVLLAGGSDLFSRYVTENEIYDPASQSWQSACSLQVPRTSAGMVALPDGRALIAGGSATQAGIYADLAETELYDPNGSLTIDPLNALVGPGDAITFGTCSGQPPYTFSMATNNSGATLDGGTYLAGPNAGQDVVRVTDSLGATSDCHITDSPVSIVPPSATTVPYGKVVFSGDGGTTGSYNWTTLVSNTGGSVDVFGTYWARSNTGTDIIQVNDGANHTATAIVTVVSPDSGTDAGTVGADGGGASDGGTDGGAISFTCQTPISLGKLTIDGTATGGSPCRVDGAKINGIMVAGSPVLVTAEGVTGSGATAPFTFLGVPYQLTQGAYKAGPEGNVTFDPNAGTVRLALLPIAFDSGKLGDGTLELYNVKVGLPKPLPQVDFGLPNLLLNSNSGSPAIGWDTGAGVVGGNSVSIAPHWDLKGGAGLDVNAQYDFSTDYLTVSATLGLPPNLEVEGDLGLAKGQVDQLGVRADFSAGVGFPLGTTGYYVVGLGGKVQGLAELAAEGYQALQITGIISIAGPAAKLPIPPTGRWTTEFKDVTVTVDFGGQVSISGQILVVGLPLADVSAALDWVKKTFTADGTVHIGFADVGLGNKEDQSSGDDFITGDLGFTVNAAQQISDVSSAGHASILLHVPHGLPANLDRFFAGVSAGGGLEFEQKGEEVTNTFTATLGFVLGGSGEDGGNGGLDLELDVDGTWKVGKLISVEGNVKAGWFSTDFSWQGQGLGSNQQGLGWSQQGLGSASFTVPAGMRRALFVMSWDGGPMDVSLTDPNGQRYSLGDRPANAIVLPAQDGSGLLVLVDQPAAGAWSLAPGDPAERRTVHLEAHEVVPPPAVSIAAPAADVTSSGSVDIQWTATTFQPGTTLSLYFEGQGTHGTPIATGLDPSAGHYLWNTAGVPGGEWRILAKIDDGLGAVRSAESAGRVTVADPNAPPRPGAPTAVARDGSITLSWPAVSGNVLGYRVYYTDDLGADTYKSFAAFPSGPAWLTGLTNGRPYKVSVAAFGQDYTQGLLSPPVVVTPRSSVGDNPPQLTWKPVQQARAGVQYAQTVTAQDVDGDPLTFSLTQPPAGMSITSSGALSWTPPIGKEGAYRITVNVGDGRGGTDQLSYTLSVTSASIANRPPVLAPITTPISITEGSPLTFRASASDPDGDAIRYGLYGSVPQGASIDPATGAFQWTPTGEAGTFRFGVRATDSGNDAAQQLIEVRVQPTPRGCGCGESGGDAATGALFAVVLLALGRRRSAPT